MPSPDVEKLFEEIKALSPPQQLRLAADMIENARAGRSPLQMLEMASIVANRVSAELGAAVGLAKAKRDKKSTEPKETSRSG